MRLIDADALKKVYVDSDKAWNIMMVHMSVIKQSIDDMPTVDAVPVVRCKDCVHFDYTDKKLKSIQRGVCEVLSLCFHHDDFCSCGERKDGKEGNNGRLD